VNEPDSKVVNWFKVHLHWEHYPHQLLDGALPKVKATDRYQSTTTATALLKVRGHSEAHFLAALPLTSAAFEVELDLRRFSGEQASSTIPAECEE
jgi:hypothetical protein